MRASSFVVSNVVGQRSAEASHMPLTRNLEGAGGEAKGGIVGLLSEGMSCFGCIRSCVSHETLHGEVG